MNEYRLSELHIGLEKSFVKTITVDMEEGFSKMSGDINPLHWDDDFARDIGKGRFSSHVTFGMLTASMYSTLVGVYLPGKYSLIHSFEELSFMNPVYVGDTLSVKGSVTDIWEDIKLIRVKASIRNQNGKLASRARIKIMVQK